jgi:hypothetical protein
MDNEINIEDKKIINITNNKIVNVLKTKKKRIVTKTKKWTFSEMELLFENQKRLLENLIDNNIILQQLNRKIYGYYRQDLKKNKYEIDKFIKIDDVVLKLKECDLDCFYCENKVQILYPNVREPMQWTLERIDNEYGHNTNNVVIACLQCNVKRRTMYHERFVFTKQIQIIREPCMKNI